MPRSAAAAAANAEILTTSPPLGRLDRDLTICKSRVEAHGKTQRPSSTERHATCVREPAVETTESFRPSAANPRGGESNGSQEADAHEVQEDDLEVEGSQEVIYAEHQDRSAHSPGLGALVAPGCTVLEAPAESSRGFVFSPAPTLSRHRLPDHGESRHAALARVRTSSRPPSENAEIRTQRRRHDGQALLRSFAFLLIA